MASTERGSMKKPAPAASPVGSVGAVGAAGAGDDGADALASRAGYKLLAAIEQFGLGAFIAGAQAIDLGACTGGFTDCLLRFGAARVTGVDVGPNQLRQHLRDDPRVEMIEKAHFKKLPLHIAPGPFGFFVVDVSHVAARSMLRGLSKRLREGAHGFVLLKPQFELPSSLVPRGGVVQSRNLRKLALNRFKKKAAQHGFALLDKADSPVAGGSGTVEILLHLRFDGVPPPDPAADGAVEGAAKPPAQGAGGAAGKGAGKAPAQGVGKGAGPRVARASAPASEQPSAASRRTAPKRPRPAKG